MKLSDVKAKIDDYFDNITLEEFYKTLIKYHMRTVFKGTINGQEFDNVQAYNAEIQRLIAAGENINATTHTEAAPELADNSFLLPGFAQCTGTDQLTDEFITEALKLDPDQFAKDVNELFHTKIVPTIAGMDRETLTKYAGIIEDIRGYLAGLAKESDEKANKFVTRLQEIEAELQDLRTQAAEEEDRKAVIDFVDSLYDSIEQLVRMHGIVADVDGCGHQDPAGEPGEPGCPCDECRCLDGPSAGSAYMEDIRNKARALFGLGI